MHPTNQRSQNESQVLPLTEQLARAMQQQDVDEIDRLVYLHYDSVQQYDSAQRGASLDVLHELLLQPGHQSHQRVVFTLQALKDPRSVPFLQQALAAPFDYLDYTCSESQVIAKWFSHALLAIGTPEAIQVLREFARSPDPGIREEMQARITDGPCVLLVYAGVQRCWSPFPGFELAWGKELCIVHKMVPYYSCYLNPSLLLPFHKYMLFAYQLFVDDSGNNRPVSSGQARPDGRIPDSFAYVGLFDWPV
jgi:HEAT repeat protein